MLQPPKDKRHKPHPGVPLSPKVQGFRDRKAFEAKRADVNRRAWATRKGEPKTE